LFNRFISWLAATPFHRLISQSIVVVQYIGRRSGDPYTVPVNYVISAAHSRRRLWITSAGDRVWWRNFIGGNHAELLLSGDKVPVELFAVIDPKDVEAGMLEYLEGNPRAARYFNVKVDEDGLPAKDDLHEAAKDRVMVYADL
jgi:hypothetical protein